MAPLTLLEVAVRLLVVCRVPMLIAALAGPASSSRAVARCAACRPAEPQEPITVELSVTSGSTARRAAPALFDLAGVENFDATREWAAHLVAEPAAIPVQVDVRREPEGSPAQRVSAFARWIEPTFGAGEVRERTLVLMPAENAPSGLWHFETVGDGVELRRGESPVWRDVSRFDPADFETTYKAYHHLFGPGGLLLTKGAGGTHAHHRGLFAGWSKTKCREQTYNFWYTPEGHTETQTRDLVLERVAGPVFARERTTSRWMSASPDDETAVTIVRETRTLVAWDVGPDERLIDVEVELQALAFPVELDGDSAHAGVQVRLSQEVAETESCRYVLPEGAEAHENDDWTKAAWAAALFAVAGEPHTLLFVNHPENSGAVTWNTRAYGRFGAFFRRTLKPRRPLVLRYRLWIVRGQLDDVSVLGAVAEDLATPLVATRAE